MKSKEYEERAYRWSTDGGRTFVVTGKTDIFSDKFSSRTSEVFVRDGLRLSS